MPAADLELLPVAEGGGRYAITACFNGDSLTDRLLITSARSRAAFVKRLCERWPQVNPANVERLLEQLAREYTEGRAPRQDGPADGELDPSTVLRPERFITPRVCGFAMPVLGDQGDEPVGRWTLLLQWADGRRERRGLAASPRRRKGAHRERVPGHVQGPGRRHSQDETLVLRNPRPSREAPPTAGVHRPQDE